MSKLQRPATQAAPRKPATKSAGRSVKAPAPRGSDEAISVELGLRIKALRAESALSLEQLSQRAGVSRAMLSSIERGEKSPTLPIIVRIAGGFGLSLSGLLGAAPDLASVSVIRSSERLAYRDPATGFERWVLSPAHLDNGLEFVLHRLPPGRTTGMLPAYAVPTEKYVVVTEGQLTVYVDNKPYVLKAGDSMYFEVKSPYRFANDDGRAACAYYMVIVRKR
ncbi:helix-turn-helix domain-containing protein [Variovorax sp.]|uniref:helix-turn-helix domain-containing protein n=1 Tax=Variovorax sp. TaxID=1871043 RepID=UPI00137DEC47|nr:XRE family transcriptional regulator [Variovorax sp.]KAF1066097.1 MAG: HTH-type transcriptional regulator SutR [Variovorax sp.]